jgi:phosphoribosylanthranilate isomerase
MKKLPEIKICGITNFSDAEKSISLGADYLGFILHPSSPRFIDLNLVAELFKKLRDHSCKKVLVDVNPEPEMLKLYLQEGFEFFQLHFPHDISINRIDSWKKVIGAENLWLAPKIPPQSEFPPELMNYADHFLVDAYSSSAFGGTGEQSDWEEFSRCKDRYSEKKWILAGGLGLENAKLAISSLHPDIMDFNSAIEVEPGKKDHRKLSSLFSNLRA